MTINYLVPDEETHSKYNKAISIIDSHVHVVFPVQ